MFLCFDILVTRNHNRKSTLIVIYRKSTRTTIRRPLKTRNKTSSRGSLTYGHRKSSYTVLYGIPQTSYTVEYGKKKTNQCFTLKYGHITLKNPTGRCLHICQLHQPAQTELVLFTNKLLAIGANCYTFHLC